jgi:hypothetical protein
MSFRGALLALAFVACGSFGASAGAGSAVIGADEPGEGVDGGYPGPSDRDDDGTERRACPDGLPGVDSTPCRYAAASGASSLASAR